jgi:hypothetical protein
MLHDMALNDNTKMVHGCVKQNICDHIEVWQVIERRKAADSIPCRASRSFVAGIEEPIAVALH